MLLDFLSQLTQIKKGHKIKIPKDASLKVYQDNKTNCLGVPSIISVSIYSMNIVHFLYENEQFLAASYFKKNYPVIYHLFF